MPAEPIEQTNELLKSLVELTGKNTETLTRLLSVARFGPTAGVGGGAAGRREEKRPKSAAEIAQEKFEARQQVLRERGSALQQLGMVSAGGGYHRAASMAEGALGMGMTGASSALQRMAMPLAIAQAFGSAMSTAGAVARIGHDPWTTGEEKGRQLFRMLPGGETVQKFIDDISGRAAKMEAVDVRASQSRAREQHYATQTAFAMSYRPIQAGREAVAGAYARQGASGAADDSFRPVMDRSSARSEVEFQNQMKLLPFKKEVLRTERELTRVTRERQEHESIATELAERQKKLEKDRADTQRAINKGGEGPDRRALLRRHELLSQAIEQTANQRIQAEQRSADARAGEATAKGEHSKAQSRLQFQAQAEVKQAAAERSMSTARTLGEMDPLSRQQGMNVLEMLRNGANPDLLPPEMKSLARQVAPAEYDKIITRHGAQTETFQRGQQAGLVGFEGDPFALQKEADDLYRQGEQAEFKADSQASKEVGEAGARLGARIKELVQSLIDTAQREIENQLRIARSSQS